MKKKKKRPGHSTLKKKKRNSRTKYVQCELFSLTGYNSIRFWKDANLTRSGETVKDFLLFPFFQYWSNVSWTCIAFVIRERLIWELVSSRPIQKYQRIKERKACRPPLLPPIPAFTEPWNQSSEHLKGTSASMTPPLPPSLEQLKFQSCFFGSLGSLKTFFSPPIQALSRVQFS